MKKSVKTCLLVLSAIAVIVIASGTIVYFGIHDYSKATCTKAKTCSICGKEKGEPKGHRYSEATCTKAAECEECGEIKGNPIGHTKDIGRCEICGKVVNKDDLDKIRNALAQAYMYEESAFSYLDNFNYYDGYEACKSVINNYECVYSYFDKAKNICSKYESLKSLEEAISDAQRVIPLTINGNSQNDIIAYLENCKDFVLAFYVVQSLDDLTNY